MKVGDIIKMKYLGMKRKFKIINPINNNYDYHDAIRKELSDKIINLCDYAIDYIKNNPQLFK